MKLLFILWLFTTIFLTISIVGLILLIPQNATDAEKDNIPSTWMQIGIKILDAFIEQEKNKKKI